MGKMNQQANKSVQRLIELGVCQPSDIKKARDEAERFSSKEFTAKIRKAGRLLGALGDSTRIKMLLLLSEGEMCVCELESALGLSQPTASHHLSVLEQIDLVERNKKGRWAFYRVHSSATLDLLKELISQ